MGKLINILQKIIAGSIIIIVDAVGKYLLALANGGAIDWATAFTGPEIQIIMLVAAWQIWETLVKPEMEYETAAEAGTGWTFVKL